MILEVFELYANPMSESVLGHVDTGITGGSGESGNVGDNEQSNL